VIGFFNFWSCGRDLTTIPDAWREGTRGWPQNATYLAAVLWKFGYPAASRAAVDRPSIPTGNLHRKRECTKARLPSVWRCDPF
jgi:hypothetical protein